MLHASSLSSAECVGWSIGFVRRTISGAGLRLRRAWIARECIAAPMSMQRGMCRRAWTSPALAIDGVPPWKPWTRCPQPGNPLQPITATRACRLTAP